MKTFFVGLVVGAVLTAFTGWYFLFARKNQNVRRVQDATTSALQNAADLVQGKLVAWHLTAGDIQKELTKTGRVVRRQVGDFGSAMADAGSDAAITAKIKAKYALDKELSAWKISVSTSGGHVSLSGTMPSHELIGKAVMIALDTDGVRDVSSTLQVKK